jgi:hypothetical protein
MQFAARSELVEYVSASSSPARRLVGTAEAPQKADGIAAVPRTVSSCYGRGGNALEMSAFAGSRRIFRPPYHPQTLLIIVSRRGAEMTVQVVSRTVVVIALLMLTVRCVVVSAPVTGWEAVITRGCARPDTAT